MQKADYLPSQAVLRQLLDLDEVTGALRWRERPGAKAWNTRYAGQVVKFYLDKDGYSRFEVRAGGQRIRARVHRVVFKMTHGYEPEMVDHRHGLAAGNGAENLRPACVTTNRWNSSKRKGRGLPKHVYRYKGRLYVEMNVSGTRYGRSGFATVEAAEAYAVGLANLLQGDFAPVVSQEIRP